ncbi:hypothetical protein GHT09_009701 [Marmota monax]|uniref:Uncharacterized protein n=1 Tax=Marmota monax TaxID=9995 RepID=A0A834V2E6_MARMO|nr:hypothetical protein GHT09_009701 [Marmota monax]
MSSERWVWAELNLEKKPRHWPQSLGDSGPQKESVVPGIVDLELTREKMRSPKAMPSGTYRFGRLSHHSFFSRHHPHPHHVTHVPDFTGRPVCIVRNKLSASPLPRSSILSQCLKVIPSISVPIGDPQSNRNPQLSYALGPTGEEQGPRIFSPPLRGLEEGAEGADFKGGHVHQGDRAEQQRGGCGTKVPGEGDRKSIRAFVQKFLQSMAGGPGRRGQNASTRRGVRVRGGREQTSWRNPSRAPREVGVSQGGLLSKISDSCRTSLDTRSWRTGKEWAAIGEEEPDFECGERFTSQLGGSDLTRSRESWEGFKPDGVTSWQKEEPSREQGARYSAETGRLIPASAQALNRHGSQQGQRSHLSSRDRGVQTSVLQNQELLERSDCSISSPSCHQCTQAGRAFGAF